MEVWERLDRTDPQNREGLAQAHVFLGDRLAELGQADRRGGLGVRAERAGRALWSAPDARGRPMPPRSEHLSEQLERRLRRCLEGGLTRLRSEGLLPQRVLRLAMVAARIEGVEPDAIAEGPRLDGAEVGGSCGRSPGGRCGGSTYAAKATGAGPR